MNAAEIQARLKHYRGSDILAHLTPTMLLTEGALYLAQAAKCFWLFNLYASHLAEIDGDLDWFNCLKLSKQREGPRVLVPRAELEIRSAGLAVSDIDRDRAGRSRRSTRRSHRVGACRLASVPVAGGRRQCSCIRRRLCPVRPAVEQRNFERQPRHHDDDRQPHHGVRGTEGTPDWGAMSGVCGHAGRSRVGLAVPKPRYRPAPSEGNRCRGSTPHAGPRSRQ